MTLVEGGHLTISLFHGTSTIYLDSIIKNGLGGDNPIAKLKVLPVACRLFTLCDHYFCDDDRWMQRRLFLESCVTQELTCGKFNFRHGDTYLTVDRSIASSYAISNRLGSELISLVAELHDDLRSIGASELTESLIADSPIWELRTKLCRPILIEFPRPSVSILQCEQDEPILEKLDFLEKCLPYLDDPRCRMPISFKLTAPVPLERLRLHWIWSRRETGFSE